jgi:hypothetical protein
MCAGLDATAVVPALLSLVGSMAYSSQDAQQAVAREGGIPLVLRHLRGQLSGSTIREAAACLGSLAEGNGPHQVIASC